MDAIQIQLTAEPAEQDWQTIEDNINRFNIQTTGYDDYLPLGIFARDASGELVAGLTAFTWGGTLRVLNLWVREDWRGHGYGSRLLTMAEQEALTRGCQQVVLETHSFQAPEFYPARGYAICGASYDNPVGYRQFTAQKRLVKEDATTEY